MGENGSWKKVGENVKLPARSLFVAAGTQPNITYEHERPGTFQIEPRTKSFRPFVAVRPEDNGQSVAGLPGVLDETGFAAVRPACTICTWT